MEDTSMQLTGVWSVELKDIIAPDQRPIGLSCLNCANLVCEYDLDGTNRSGAWVCDKFKEYAGSEAFPFKSEMPCFELCFWFSIFAQNLPPNDLTAYETAMESFAQFIDSTGRNN